MHIMQLLWSFKHLGIEAFERFLGLSFLSLSMGQVKPKGFFHLRDCDRHNKVNRSLNPDAVWRFPA
jgi:hypothetical protein